MLLALLTLLVPATVQEPVREEVAPSPPEPQWTKSVSTFWIEPPHSAGYLSAIVAADRGPLHLEAHWAYEDRDTFSIFAGRNFPFEGDLSGRFTPRIGVATGDSDGIVPALNLALNWKALTFTTDAEYLIATSKETDDFFYSWTELDYALSDRFTVGLVGQRTHVFDEHLTVDRGFLFGVRLAKTQLTAYVFNPDLDDPYVSIAFGAGF